MLSHDDRKTSDHAVLVCKGTLLDFIAGRELDQKLKTEILRKTKKKKKVCKRRIRREGFKINK